MSNKTNQWINMGVVAALVFSVPRISDAICGWFYFFQWDLGALHGGSLYQCSVLSRGTGEAVQVLFSAINQPFGKITADDMWADHREHMNKVLICLLYISTIFGLITVVLTILLLIHMASFVNDADDFLFFVKLNPSGARDLMVSVFFFGWLIWGIYWA